MPNRGMRAGAAALVVAAGTLSASFCGAPAHASTVAIHPGDMIRLALIEYGCTVGMTGHIDGEPVAVTAGHCAPSSSGAAYPQFDATPIGSIRAVAGMDDLDYAVVELNAQSVVRHTPIWGLTPVLGHAESRTREGGGGSEMIRESWPERITPMSSVVSPSTCTSPLRERRCVASPRISASSGARCATGSSCTGPARRPLRTGR